MNIAEALVKAYFQTLYSDEANPYTLLPSSLEN